MKVLCEMCTLPSDNRVLQKGEIIRHLSVTEHVIISYDDEGYVTNALVCLCKEKEHEFKAIV